MSPSVLQRDSELSVIRTADDNSGTQQSSRPSAPPPPRLDLDPPRPLELPCSLCDRLLEGGPRLDELASSGTVRESGEGKAGAGRRAIGCGGSSLLPVSTNRRRGRSSEIGTPPQKIPPPSSVAVAPTRAWLLMRCCPCVAGLPPELPLPRGAVAEDEDAAPAPPSAPEAAFVRAAPIGSSGSALQRGQRRSLKHCSSHSQWSMHLV